MKPQFLVIGLGRFGSNLALQLMSNGAEVLGIDADEEAVNAIADQITHCLIADTTEERNLKEIGVDQFDAAICAVGSDFEASLMTTLLLKELGARRLIAKAGSRLHGKVLEKIGASQVVYPEQDMAIRLAHQLQPQEGLVELLPLSVQAAMFEIQAPRSFCGRTLAELTLPSRYGLTVIAVRRGGETTVSPQAAMMIREGDLLVVAGDRARAREAVAGR